MTNTIRIVSLIVVIAVLACLPVTAAVSAPDYTKIVQIRLTPAGTGYMVSSMDVQYGRAPNLDLKSGPLTATVSDAGGNALSTFSLRDPGIVQADSLAPGDDNSLVGYTGATTLSALTITIPYRQGMSTFNLADSRTGAILATADLTEPISSFCTDYPADPDCISRIVPEKQSAPDSGMLLFLAAIFSASVIMAAGLAIMTLRKRQMPLIVPAPAETVLVKQTVLIVDDDPDVVEIIHQFLADEGYATIRAPGGKECLEILRHQLPDLILLDVLMQPMSGWETLEQIKKDPITKTIPVLMLTGKRLTSQEAKQYNICIDDYIMKPFRHEEIFAAIDNILQRKQRLKDNLELAKKAGVDREKFCELARLSRRISVNKKIIGILQGPERTQPWDDDITPENREAIEQISSTTRVNEKRAEQLKNEINSVFRSKGLPEITW